MSSAALPEKGSMAGFNGALEASVMDIFGNYTKQR